MTDILIRNVSSQTLARIDARAASLGLSRNEYLRRHLDDGVAAAPHASAVLSADDVRRASRAAADLDNAEVMSAAWR